MGTDIHLYVERRKGATDLGPWELVPCPKDRIPEWRKGKGAAHLPAELLAGCYGCEGTGKPKYPDDDPPSAIHGKCMDCGGTGVSYETWYHDRNYDVFAVLADVRNGCGFAGVKTGDGFMVIGKEPRGLPKDMSPELAEIAECCLEHTPSWHLASDLLAFPWADKRTRHCGVIGIGQFASYKGGRPASWCGDVSGPKVLHLSHVEAAAWLLKNKPPTKSKDPFDDSAECADGFGRYVRVEWEETYAESCKDFVDEFLPRLKGLGPADKVRIVFWFDS